MRVVLDSNVLLAGIATHGLCEALLAVCFRNHEVTLCEHILDEVREHYQAKFKATPEQAAIVIATLRRRSRMIEPDPMPLDAFEDRDDLPILGTASACKAEYLITGDKALLRLGKIRDTLILSPRAFCDRIRE